MERNPDLTALEATRLRQSPRVPIGDYGFLSDGEATALISPGGSIHWMCVPRIDSPSRPRGDTCPAR
jgi:alpha,alpha-trehalase